MNRQEGYYWVKIDNSHDEYKFYGNHWRAALWYFNNGDGSQLQWKIAGDENIFYDTSFSEINDIRILSPDEQELTSSPYGKDVIKALYNNGSSKTVLSENLQAYYTHFGAPINADSSIEEIEFYLKQNPHIEAATFKYLRHNE